MKNNVIACKHVIDKKRKILLVYNADGELQYTCGSEDHDSYYDFVEVEYQKLLSLDPTLSSLKALALGELAVRDKIDDDWNFEFIKPELLGAVNDEYGVDENYAEMLRTIDQKGGFWIAVNRDGDCGATASMNNEKYVPIWIDSDDVHIAHDNLEFIAVNMFFEKFGEYLLENDYRLAIHSEGYDYIVPIIEFLQDYKNIEKIKLQ